MANIRRDASAADNALGHEAGNRTVTAMLDRMLDLQRRTGHDLGRIYSDAVTAAVHTLRMVPVHRDAIAATGRMANDDPDTAQIFADLHGRYGDHLGHLAEILGILITEAQAMPYEDLLGPLYMLVRSRWAGSSMGQYFTPETVAIAMAQMTAQEIPETVCGRLRHAAEASNWAPTDIEQLLAWARGDGPEPSDDLDLGGHYVPVLVGEPCVGSGTLVLAVASQLPRPMVARGLVQFDVTDLDPLCARMAWLNCMLHGLVAVVRQGNTLTLDLQTIGMSPAMRDAAWRHHQLKQVA